MVNFHDPVVFALNRWDVVKLNHALAGIYFWEFFTTLDFEWSVVQGHRPYLRTIWIYSFTRLATLMATILNLFVIDVTIPINCQVWVIFNFAFGYGTFALSSLLIVLRVVAIWNKNRAVVVLAVSVWSINLLFLIRGKLYLPSRQSSCGSPSIESNRATVISMLVTDFVLLLIMLCGLHRLRHNVVGTFELGRLLWKQVRSLLFLLAVMYRSLVDFVSTNVADDSGGAKGIGCTVTDAELTISIPPPNSQTEGTVSASYELHSMSQTGHHVSYVNMDGQLRNKPHGLSFDDDLESGAEK
ncbi:hypothetical protein BJV74DRAFT_868632 [Russula compacta]|nr:hypothetical protein BJV74DRAFT_868632 [Russula compacta]